MDADLFRRLDGMGISNSPFAKKLSAEDARRVRFVRPKLVAEVEFRSWTAEGLIRMPPFGAYGTTSLRTRLSLNGLGPANKDELSAEQGAYRTAA